MLYPHHQVQSLHLYNHPTLFQLGQKNYRLHMRRSREEINGCRFFDFISKLFEHSAVACERGRVAGDIHYPVGSHFCGGFNRLLRAALARRVEDYPRSFSAASPASAQMNCAFSMPFAAAFFFASSIAGATVSMPMSSSALSAIESPIVPAPQ